MSKYADKEATEDNTYDYDDDGGEKEDTDAENEVPEKVYKEPKEKVTPNRICDWCIERCVSTPRTKANGTNLCSKHLQEYNDKVSGEWQRKIDQKEIDKEQRRQNKLKEIAKLNIAKNKRYAEENIRNRTKIAKINDEINISQLAVRRGITFEAAAVLFYATKSSPAGSKKSSKQGSKHSSKHSSPKGSKSGSKEVSEDESEEDPLNRKKKKAPAEPPAKDTTTEALNAQLSMILQEMDDMKEENNRVREEITRIAAENHRLTAERDNAVNLANNASHASKVMTSQKGADKATEETTTKETKRKPGRPPKIKDITETSVVAPVVGGPAAAIVGQPVALYQDPFEDMELDV